ncbi:MAG: CvpA family protein [Corallococcus sp.]|nr:CvpA family protein [Corallococcus sp.]
MNILDYIIIAAFVLSLVLGALKGLLKQIFAIAGFFIVVFGSAALAPYVQNWFSGLLDNESTRMLIAMILSAVLLGVATAVVSLLVRKIATRNKTVGVLNRILGGAVSLVIAYFAVSVVIELVLHTGEGFLPATKAAVGSAFEESWIVNHLYKTNFFGRLIVDGIAQQLLEKLRPVALAFAAAM